jgi:4a-hydroxytetrahydrobiopterin dehydratase
MAEAQTSAHNPAANTAPPRRQKERTYSEAEIAQKLAELPGWYYEDGWIRRQYKTDGWPTTLMLVNTIGYLAEAAYHHPDLAVTWAKVWVKLQNHAAGGITDKDFELARKIEDSVLWRPSGGALEGTPNKFVRGGDPK